MNYLKNIHWPVARPCCIVNRGKNKTIFNENFRALNLNRNKNYRGFLDTKNGWVVVNNLCLHLVYEKSSATLSDVTRISNARGQQAAALSFTNLGENGVWGT